MWIAWLMLLPIATIVMAQSEPNKPAPTSNSNPVPVAPPPPSSQKKPSLSEGIPVGSEALPSNLPRLNMEGVKDPVQLTEGFMLKYIIRPVFFLSGGVAIIMILYSSFQIITARGEEDGLTSAKTTLTWAFVGLGLVVLAYTIVSNLASIILQLV
jgi:hypothetical protein